MEQDYYSDFAKQKYKDLQNKPPEKLTEKQKEFVTTMYHIEEEYVERMLENEAESFLWGY